MPKITYYDFTNIIYSGLFVAGFQDCEDEYGYTFKVSNKVPPEFEDLNPIEWLEYTLQPYSIFRYEGNESFIFCIDAGDLNGSEETGGYFEPFLDRSRYFFKVNYNPEVIAQTDRLKRYSTKIKPVPVVYPIAVNRPWQLRPRIGRPGWTLGAIKRRTKDLLKTVTLSKYRKLREINKDLDLFFITTLYDNPIHEEENEKRRVLVDLMNDKMDKYEIFAKYICLGNDSGAACRPNETEVMHHRDVLINYARSRIGIYIRGLDGCLSYKFGEMMALGKPMVGETILNNKVNMYSYDHFEEQFAFDDPEELIEGAIYLLEHSDYLEELERFNVETYENHFTPIPVANYILNQMDIC